MFDIYKKFKAILLPHERRNAGVLFGLIVVAGIMEAAGVASIMPFLAVLTRPEIVHENALLAFFYRELHFTGTNRFLFFLGGAVFVIVVMRIGLRALTQYSIIRYSHMRNYRLSTRLLRIYLARPYGWFLNRHSADLGKTVLSEVQQVIDRVLIPSLQLVAGSVISLALIGLMLIVNPAVAMAAALLLGGSYALIYLMLRKFTSASGAARVAANQARYQIAQEALGGIKEIKAGGLEAGYLAGFGKPALRFAHSQAANAVVGQLPNYLLQVITFGGIVASTLFMLERNNGDLSRVLITLGVFAFAVQRLMPALNQVYANATNMRFSKPALDAFYADFMEQQPDYEALTRMDSIEKPPPLGLKDSLALVGVTYSYPHASRPALGDIDVRIAVNSTVGIVGSTGAGKTTLVDVILGLLTPQQGQLQVDGVPIAAANLPAWQRTLGYVPQHIFLADDSICANIAFGVPADQVDHQAVARAARIAELHSFVENELEKGYRTRVGERGVRLSGGQRQRIGMARALYHDPDVLILDEATSALDNVTERAVMQAVHNLGKRKTILLIAHRLSTVRDCDVIFMLEAGRLAASGTYDALIQSNSHFRKMAAAATA